jgi:hypothetical protein
MAHQADRSIPHSWLHQTVGKEPDSSNNAESGLDPVRNFGLGAEHPHTLTARAVLQTLFTGEER